MDWPTEDFKQFLRIPIVRMTTRVLNLKQVLVEDLQAGVWQVIECMKFVGFLTPDMASKNDASYGIELS